MVHSLLTEKEKAHLAHVIGQWEMKTSGEIRLVIVGRSAVISHVPLLLWAVMVATTFLIHEVFRTHLLAWEQWWQWPVILIGEFILARWLAGFTSIQRRFTAPQDLHHQAWSRAELEFHREGLTQTKERTGILVFMSLMEHKAVVLADRGIADKVPTDAWEHVVATILEGARNKSWVTSLEKALNQCGEYLTTHFPVGQGDRNELPNTVIIKD